jgi:hypothetical protein
MRLLAILFTVWVAAIITAFLMSGCAALPQNTAHRVDLKTGICSATAVGPHTLLSAGHCFTDKHSILIDGKPAAVLNVIPDGADHVLVIVTATFTDIATRGQMPGVGGNVEYWGNPDGLHDIYRRGYIVGPVVVDDKYIILLNANGAGPASRRHLAGMAGHADGLPEVHGHAAASVHGQAVGRDPVSALHKQEAPAVSAARAILLGEVSTDL